MSGPADGCEIEGVSNVMYALDQFAAGEAVVDTSTAISLFGALYQCRIAGPHHRHHVLRRLKAQLPGKPLPAS